MLDILSKVDTSVKSVDDFKLILKESLEDEKFSYQVSNARQVHILLKGTNLRIIKSGITCGSTIRCSLMPTKSLRSQRSLVQSSSNPL